MFKSLLYWLTTRDAVTEDHAEFLYNLRKRNILIRFLQAFILIVFLVYGK